jgi:hypothetical protein
MVKATADSANIPNPPAHTSRFRERAVTATASAANASIPHGTVAARSTSPARDPPFTVTALHGSRGPTTATPLPDPHTAQGSDNLCAVRLIDQTPIVTTGAATNRDNHPDQLLPAHESVLILRRKHKRQTPPNPAKIENLPRVWTTFFL